MKPIEATNQYAAVLPILNPLCCDLGLWADIWMLHEGLPGRLQPQAARSMCILLSAWKHSSNLPVSWSHTIGANSWKTYVDKLYDMDKTLIKMAYVTN